MEFERTGRCRFRGAWRRGQPCVDLIEPSRQPPPIAIECAAAEPRVSRPPVPGDHPVVEGQSEGRQVLVGWGDRRQPLERGAEVVAEEADQAAEERRRVRRDDDRPVEPRDKPARHRERIRTGRRRLQDRDGIRREVRPARIASRSGALEQDEAGQVAKRLGGIDRASTRDAVGEPTEPERRTGSIGRDHLPPDDTATRPLGPPGRPLRACPPAARMPARCTHARPPSRAPAPR